MAKSKHLPPIERLREVFTADDEGRLYWRDNAHRAVAGKEIKTKNSCGYLQVRFQRKNYQVHRIVWALIHGTDPSKFMIDHINGDKTDNHPLNMRLCNGGQNQLNSKIPLSNTSGVKGVYLDPRPLARPWRSQYRGKKLGYFATKEEAVNALAIAVEQCADKRFYRFDFAQ